MLPTTGRTHPQVVEQVTVETGLDASKQQARQRRRAVGLALPLIAFVLATFVTPLGTLLVRSVYDPLVADALPETLALLREWDGTSTLAEPVYAAAARELLRAREDRTSGQIATRVNRIKSGLRSVVTRSARKLRNASGDSWRETMIGIDAAWGEPDIWLAMRSAGERFTFRHYTISMRSISCANPMVASPGSQRNAASTCRFCGARWPLALALPHCA